MKYNKKTNCFVVNKNTVNDYKQLQEIRFKEDIKNHSVYSTEEIIDLVKNYKFQHILDKFKSIGHRGLLFSFHTFEKMSILQAAIIRKTEHFKVIDDFLQIEDFVSINENGGISAFKGNIEELEDYVYLQDLIHDNDTFNLIIENDGVIEPSLLSKLDSVIDPSYILHYKDIAREPVVHNFLTSRNDWCLWIHTQGMDLDLYDKFLKNYNSFIKEIHIDTTKKALLDNFAKSYPKISFYKID